MGRVYSENPLKSAQTRSENVSPPEGVTPIPHHSPLVRPASWPSSPWQKSCRSEKGRKMGTATNSPPAIALGEKHLT